jgi:hypothetical protein
VLTNSEQKELEQLREYASKAIMSPIDRAFFELQRIIDTYPNKSAIRVLAVALHELRRETNK